ncbi:MAG: DUF465 domain-containing protein [Deltaproteobacteria bacterium]|nr:DUF465 domain-containing protein [Deltaproteobacteria bacterium]
MEQHDLELITKLSEVNEELAALWKEHQNLEGQLEDMNRRLYLTPEEEVERKRIQKLKLAGRDRIETILAEHRADRGKI